MSNPPHKVFLIVGPTASGKSALAFDMAKEVGGAIVNADSVQMYQRLNIGTAKPPESERKEIPHYLFDVIAACDEGTAGTYYPEARELVEELVEKQSVFIVGGSGFYIQALEKGMYNAPAADEVLIQQYQTRLTEEGEQALYDELKKRDGEYSAKVASADSYRVIRALSLMDQMGSTMTEIQKDFQNKGSENHWQMPLEKIGLLPGRDWLRARVQKRIIQMKAKGLRAEVEALLADGLEKWAPMSSVGYKETVQWIHGELSEEEWAQKLEISTMQLAKRQSTWFRRDKQIRWFNPEEGLESAKEMVRSCLS